MCDVCKARSRAFRNLWKAAIKLDDKQAQEGLREAYAEAARQINAERDKGDFSQHEVADPKSSYEEYLEREAFVSKLVDGVQAQLIGVEVDAKSFPAFEQNPDKLKN